MEADWTDTSLKWLRVAIAQALVRSNRLLRKVDGRCRFVDLDELPLEKGVLPDERLGDSQGELQNIYEEIST